MSETVHASKPLNLELYFSSKMAEDMCNLMEELIDFRPDITMNDQQKNHENHQFSSSCSI